MCPRAARAAARMKKKTRVIIVVIILICVALIVGRELFYQAQTKDDPGLGVKVTLSELTVESTSDGKDLIIMDLVFTNLTQKTTSYNESVKLELYQNDMKLMLQFVRSEDWELISNAFNRISHADYIKVREVYVLHDTENPVEYRFIDVSEFLEHEVILEGTLQLP